METISSEKIMSTLREELAQINATVDRQEASVVTEVADGIARISGLKTAMAGELLKLTSSATGLDVYGLVQNLDQDDVGAVLFGDAEEIKEGDECRTTGPRRATSAAPPGASWTSRSATPCSAAW